MKLRGGFPSIHSTRHAAIAAESKVFAYRIEKHLVRKVKILAGNLLLGDFVEGENFEASDWLYFLDPTGAVSDAVALHRILKKYGSPS